MKTAPDLIKLFLKSRREGLSPRTLQFYQGYLARASSVLGLNINSEAIRHFLSELSCSPGGKHAYYRTLRCFYGWLYSDKSGLRLKPRNNPMLNVDAPKVDRKLLPAQTPEQLSRLIKEAEQTRDKAILSLFADSGLRLLELANIRVSDIDWTRRLIKVKCKGNKEGLAVFGFCTERLLKEWLSTYNPNGGSIWGLKVRGVEAMLSRLERKTGVKCNAHSIRRGFATILSKRGVDSLHIMRLGRWQSLAMVDRYTRSVQFEDSLKYYTPIVE